MARQAGKGRGGAAAELVFIPLGGVGEIGMNLGVYGLGDGRERRFLIVDCGMSFPGDEAPGIEVVYPDIRFLVEERAAIEGIVITHAHEDHIGALMDLWPELRCKVYASPFAAALFAAKRLMEPGAPDIPITIVPLRSRFHVGPFDIEMIDVAHSIPESNALAIRTPLGVVLHTGDFKLDPTPVIGQPTDLARLASLGAEGVSAIICDSTNAYREGRSPSEADVAVALAEIIKVSPGRVAVTTFASNVARLRSVALAAAKCDRHVVLVGRAMQRVATVAREMGMLDGVPGFLAHDAYGYLPRDKVVALVTGSQGEERAALARIAADDHPDITLAKGDRVIFSSRTIPGNEKTVGAIINGLVGRGIEVITDRSHLVHVSGHPRRDELAEVYRLVKPRIAVPVHGEPFHLAAHAELARSLGVPEVVTITNGDMLRLLPGPAEVIDEVPVGRVYKDGAVLVGEEEATLADRRRLSFAGVVSVSVVLTDKGALAADPMIDLTGLPAFDREGEEMADVVGDAVAETIETLPKARRRDPEAVAESLKRAVRSACQQAWGKKPMCHVLVTVL